MEKIARYRRRAKLLQHMLNQARKAPYRHSIKYKFGVQIPRNYKEALALDGANGNTIWQDAIEYEIDCMSEYQVFHSIGYKSHPPRGYIKIPSIFVFDCKASGQRRARMAAGGHRTPEPDESVYSSVAALRSLRLICFLAEQNGLPIMAGDVGSAYLTSFTKEKVCFTAGPEFGPLAGHTMIIDRALYGLRTPGKRYHESFADVMYNLGFKPSFADSDVWMRDAGNHYDYVVVYVDDIIAVMDDP